MKGPIGKRGSSKVSLTVVRSKLKARRGGKGFKGRTKNIDVQFSFDLSGDEMRKIVGGIVVTCFYPGGNSRSGVEVYDPPAPFKLGAKREQFANDKPSAILGTKTRKRYTMDARRKGDKVTGTIQVSYGFWPTTRSRASPRAAPASARTPSPRTASSPGPLNERLQLPLETA